MFSFNSIRSTVADLISPENAIERRRLSRLVDLDALTGLANRRAFDLALPTAESDPQTSVVLFDANNFGRVNKAAGQRFGDVALREISDVIKRTAQAFGVGGRAFRIGGDEFVVLCPTAIAGQLRDNVEAGFGVRYPGLDVSVSGTVGDTFAAADDTLQGRKRARKGAK